MNKIERPRVIKFPDSSPNNSDYNKFIAYFEGKKNGWTKTGIGYSQEAHNSFQNYVILNPSGLEIWGMNSSEEEKLRKMMDVEKSKSKLIKLLESGKELFSLAKTNAKRDLDLE